MAGLIRYLRSIPGNALILWISFTIPLKAQNAIDLERFVPTDKPVNLARVILKDQTGYLWFATPDGLLRYNGSSVKRYLPDNDDSTSLPFEHIYTLVEENEQYLWVGTKGSGISRFEKATGKCLHFNMKNKKGINSDFITTLATDNNGVIWAASDEGNHVFKFNVAKQAFEHSILLSGTERNESIEKIFVDSHNRLWISTPRSGLFITDQRHMSTVSLSSEAFGLPQTEFHGVAEQNDTTYWLGGNSGLFKLSFTDESPVLERISAFDGIPVTALLIDKDPGNLWAGTAKGLARIDIRTHEYTMFTPPQETYGSPSPIFLSLMLDDSRVLWIGTKDGGMYRLNTRKEEFHRWKDRRLVDKTIKNNYLNYIYQTKNEWTFFGTETQGLIVLDQENKRSANIGPSLYSGFPKMIRNIVEAPNSDIYIGAYYDGIYRITVSDDIFKRRPAFERVDVGQKSNRIIRDILLDADGVLWVATKHGLVRHDPETKTNKVFSDIHGLVNNRLRRLFIDSSNYLWIGTDGGLSRLDPGLEIFENYTHENSNLSTNMTRSILEDRNGDIWVGCTSGLNKLNNENNKFINYLQNESSPLKIDDLIEDESGKIWIGTSYGVGWFQEEENKLVLFTQEDGLNPGEINAISPGRHGDRIFVSTAEGANTFNPLTLSRNTHVPPLVLEGLKINKKPYQIDLSTSSTIYLDYHQNELEFNFAALDYASPTKNRYEYILEGLNEHWQTSAEGRATFVNVPPGDYSFKIRASNNHQVWSDIASFLDISISPPWYNTLWFRSLLILSFATIVLTIHRTIVRQKNQLNKLLKVQVNKQTEEIKKSNDKLIQLNRDIVTQNEKLKETIEKLENTQNQLVQSEKAASIGVVASGIAHEIKNPINYIQGSANSIVSDVMEILEVHRAMEGALDEVNRAVSKGLVSDSNGVLDSIKKRIEKSKESSDIHALIEELQELLGTIENGANRAYNVISRMNAFSQSDERLYVKMNIVDCLEEVLVHFNISKEVSVTKHYNTTADIRCIPSKIRLVFINIIQNALDVMPGGGSIDISTNDGDGNITTIVRDSGPGIAEVEKERIFEPFHSIDAGGKGSGLGLSVAKSIVEEHHGRIWFETSSSGTTFYVRLPYHSN